LEKQNNVIFSDKCPDTVFSEFINCWVFSARN